MISIIIPVYNVEKYLPKCLDTLVYQTYRDLEFICVDDGSKDSSLQILKGYAQKDSRFHIIHQENQGLSGARNTGIKAARGEWMMFVDSDDWLDTTCCEKALAAATGDTDLVLFSYMREFANSSVPQYLFEQEAITFEGEQARWLNRRLIAPIDKDLRHPEKIDSLSTAWGKIYRTKIIHDNHLTFVDTKVIGTEDLLFNVYYFTYIQKALYLPAPLYHYRKNNITSLTSIHKPRLIEQWEELFHRIDEWIAPLNDTKMHAALDNRRALCLIGIGLNIVSSPASLSTRYHQLSAFLHRDWYRKVIRQIPFSHFPIHWKLFYGCAKHKITLGVFILLQLMKMMINK